MCHPIPLFIIGTYRADESIPDDNDTVDVSKLQLLTYDSMNYHYLVLGEKASQAFHDGMSMR